jgi:hypothetical protein
MEKKSVNPQSPKLSVTQEADSLLSATLEKVNEGFLGGKVSKLDLASWAITYALEDLSEAKIEKIRKQFFNELTFLESVVKLSRKNRQEKLTQDQFTLLQGILGQRSERTKKLKQEADTSNGVE